MSRFKRNKRNDMNTGVEIPTRKDQRAAKATYDLLSKASLPYKQVNLLVDNTKRSTELPEKAVQLLKELLFFMSEGKSISIIPSGSELSTQDAADILQVSRPHIVKLLEEGKIPYHKAGSHRRILQQDLADYELSLKKTRKASLDYLAKQAQEEDLGY
jgi:excisionase family DNA binding protein